MEFYFQLRPWSYPSQHPFFRRINFISLMLHQDVWLHKGIQFEGLPTKIPDTVQELNDKCFAQFGISHHILSYYLLRSYNHVT